MKKSIKLIALLALAVVLAISAISLTACGLPKATGLSHSIYGVRNEFYREITGLGEETLTEFAIPSKINGDPVGKIGAGAFEGTNIVRIEIPASVTEIGANAFKDCNDLVEVKILGSGDWYRVEGNKREKVSGTLDKFYLCGSDWCKYTYVRG